jgi:hypothetical protein
MRGGGRKRDGWWRGRERRAPTTGGIRKPEGVVEPEEEGVVAADVVGEEAELRPGDGYAVDLSASCAVSTCCYYQVRTEEELACDRDTDQALRVP